MGARISRATRFIKKPLETQRRVDKILEKKPKVAPSHPSSQAVLADARKQNEELFKERDRKDDNFLGRLKDFKIDTLEAPAQVPITKSDETKRSLPMSRESRGSAEIGQVPKGKITNFQLSELFAKRLEDPDTWTAETLAKHYQLDQEALSAVLKFYSDYAIVKKRDLPRPKEPTFLG